MSAVACAGMKLVYQAAASALAVAFDDSGAFINLLFPLRIIMRWYDWHNRANVLKRSTNCKTNGPT